jgi:PIN domain nuclease of toxin-antitoxin system
MIYLIDTHVLIWSIVDSDKLSKLARKIIEDQKNTILVSSVSFWEISLKYSLHKMELNGILPEQFPDLAKEIGFDLVSLIPEEVSCYHKLQGNYHKDPFDKMLIWQAIQRNISLISKDENIARYSSEGLKVVW